MKDISASDLKSRIDNHENLQLIDVREEWEYEQFNMGAKNIPLSQLISRLEELEELKDQEVILHCKMGGRTLQAAMILEQHGFSNVVLYRGGTDEWAALYGNTSSPSE